MVEDGAHSLLSLQLVSRVARCPVCYC